MNVQAHITDDSFASLKCVRELKKWLFGVPKISDEDIKSPFSLVAIRQSADELIQSTSGSLKLICEMENFICNPSHKNEISLAVHLSVKLAHSKLLLRKVDTPINFSVIVPVFNEHARVKSRISTENSDFRTHSEGEGFVLEKYRQLRWLTAENPLVLWNIKYVDDGCAHHSGRKIKKHIDELGIRDACEVLSLKKALKDKKVSLALQEFSSEEDSRKAGAVYAGMQYALNEGSDIIAYTDADLSYDLGLSGFLISPIFNKSADVVTAHRGHDLSVLQKSVSLQNNSSFEIGKKKIKTLLSIFRHELFGHILPPDTQPGFKAFSAMAAANVLALPGKERGFAFDMQILARLGYMNKSIAVCPIVCLDSSIHSTADNEKTYFDMLKTLLRIAYDINIESTSVTALLSEITNINSLDQAVVWSELLFLLGTTDKKLEKIQHYDIALIKKLRIQLDVNANNTSLSIPYSQNIFNEVSTLVSQIKLVKAYC